ncbi:MAG: SAM-dependent chlorinase/fluorinase [Nitrospiraceae bacterium]
MNPQATFVGLSGHVPPHSIEAAAYRVNFYYRYFSKRTVHVAVVAPGVSS